MSDILSIGNQNYIYAVSTQDQELLKARNLPAGTVPMTSGADTSEENLLSVEKINVSIVSKPIDQNKRAHAILNKYFQLAGVSLSEGESAQILAQVAGKSLDDLATLSDAQLRTITEDTFGKINNYKIKCNSTADLVQIARGVIAEEKFGGNVDHYLKTTRSHLNTHGKLQGVKERIEKFYPAYIKNGFDNLSEQDKAKYLKMYVKDYLVAHKSFAVIQNDLYTLIANTTDDHDRALYYSVIDELNANGVFDKFPQNQKSELTSNAIRMNLSLYNDGNLAATHFEENNGVEIMVQAQCDEQSITDAVAYVTQGVSDEEVSKNLNTYLIDSVTPFYEENRDVLENIYKKELEARKNGVEPEYTEEEQAVLDEFNRTYVAVRSGQYIGLSNNENLPKELKFLLFEEIQEADEDKEYGQVTTYSKIQQLIQENPDIINMSQEDFEKFMDEATNGNYSIVKNDIANGTHTELNTPKTQEEITAELGNNQNNSVVNTNNASGEVSTGSLGFNNTQEQPQVNPEKTKEAIIVASEKEVITKPFVESKVKTPVSIEEAVATGSLKEYKAATRTTELGLTQALLNSKVAKAVELGVELFTKLSRDVQEIAFEGLRQNSAKLAVLDKLNPEQLQNIDGSNHYMQEMIDEKIEEEETKNKKQNFEVNV